MSERFPRLHGNLDPGYNPLGFRWQESMFSPIEGYLTAWTTLYRQPIRTVLRFVPRMAPIKVGIFPLLKKNEEQVRIAKEIQAKLQPWMTVFYDDGGAVGRRYRRQDEVGTPFCVTVDFDTLGENGEELKGTVTVRHRDSMEQERIAVDALLPWLLERVR